MLKNVGASVCCTLFSEEINDVNFIVVERELLNIAVDDEVVTMKLVEGYGVFVVIKIEKDICEADDELYVVDKAMILLVEVDAMLEINELVNGNADILKLIGEVEGKFGVRLGVELNNCFVV